MTVQRSLQIRNRLGLHARAATKLVHTAQRFQSDVQLEKEGTVVNCKSIMGVLMLAAGYGAAIVVRATGDDAEAAVQAIQLLVDGKFGEDE